MSPDYLLSNFIQRPSKFDYATDQWYFDSSAYINQLMREGHELYPSLKSKLKMIKILKRSGMIVSKLKNTELDLNEEIARYRNYMTRPEPSMRITKKALTTVSTWAEMHNRNVLIGDIPWGLKRYNLMQEHHILELREYLEKALFTAHRKEISTFEAALEHIPDYLLHKSDEYMAALINKLTTEDPSLQTIFVVCGYGQSRTIPYYLYYSPKVLGGKLGEVADYKKVYSSLMSSDTPQIQMEKLVLTDLIHSDRLERQSKILH